MPGADRTRLFKLGDGEMPDDVQVVHENVWQPPTSGSRRLLVAPSKWQIEVVLSLARTWRENYYVLWVLTLPRRGERPAGRYQSPGPLTYDELADFCRRFADFFERDGRHSLWIGSTEDARLLVYDRHDYIHAYGDVGAYTAVLAQRGLSSGEVRGFDVHTHHYHAAFDDAETEVADYWEWRVFPLQEQDEE